MTTKILSPIDTVKEVDKIIEAGADELYCGVLTPDWHNKYIAGSMNRRPGGGANFTSLSELETCVDKAYNRGVPVFLTLNEHYYTEKQYQFLLEFIAELEDIGVSALIIADLALLLTLRKTHLDVKTIISTGGNTFNSQTAAFYKELGASRIILPRHLTIEELGNIVESVKDVEFEVFILNSRCPNIDGLCTFHHGLSDKSFPYLYLNACRLPYEISVLTNEGLKPGQISWDRLHIWERVHVDDHPCGACALYEFSEMGITSVKIVGRGNPTERKIADVKYIRSLLNFLENENPSREIFRNVTQKLYGEIYKRPCRIHMCYYPEVLIN
jgi:putative protease